MMKRITILLVLLVNTILLYAQRHYDYDDSGIAGGADRAFNGLLFIILLVIGAIVLLLLGNFFFKIYYGLNPEAKPEHKAQKAKEERGNKQKVEIKLNDIDSLYHPIDLGLSVKWGSVNLGVTEAWQTMFYKYYFWGELHPNIFKTYDLSSINFSDIGDISGNPQYDIVSKTINNGWRIPTKSELKELVEKCKWTKQEMGYKVEGSNGNSIFLPYTGFFTFDSNPFMAEHSDEGCYWSSTPKEETSEKLNQSAYSLTFGGRYLVPTIHERLGYNAIAIRPVKNKTV